MNLFSTYQFANAWVLWFLLLIPLLAAHFFLFQAKKNSALKLSSLQGFDGLESGILGHLKALYMLLRLAALSLFIIALARPQLSSESDSFIEHHNEGIDIVMALDASGSMLAIDFKPDRFQAAKQVAKDFVSNRKNDRIGLVIFEGEAYTQCPLTSDKKIVNDLIDEAEQGVVTEGTAIGMGLATAVNRLRESKVKSKVIILLTDGVNNQGKIHPITAAEIAKQFNIRVYTIGVGTNGKAKTPVAIDPFTNKYIYDYVDVEIDEKTLTDIADMTGGQYFRATDNQKLKEIYEQIDQLEKDKIKTIEYEVDLPEKSFPFILIGFILILIEFLLRSTLFKSVS
ncbi:MAG: VWA domain-containing protein [Flavobacteriales bacterium]|jgi:Ca-activated chloride channel family protein|nr:VWA domain-containing protein [Flavobacteriales bacterium]